MTMEFKFARVSQWLAFGVFAFLAVAGCGGGGGGNTAASLVSIQITPATASIAEGTTQQYVATGTYTDSSTQDLSSTVTWNSAATGVAAVSSAGLVTGVGAGTSSIIASVGADVTPDAGQF